MTKSLTPERIEQALDNLAILINDYGKRGRELLPMYERLEKELADIRAEDALMASVRLRLTRSQDQGGAQSA